MFTFAYLIPPEFARARYTVCPLQEKRLVAINAALPCISLTFFKLLTFSFPLKAKYGLCDFNGVGAQEYDFDMGI